jgi:tetratricopeptide (TPR) repeat protein
MSNGADPVGEDATPDSGGERERLRAALAAHNHGVAIESLTRAEAIAPDDAPTRLALGVALQGAGRHEEALAQFQRVGDGTPEKGAAELHCALCLLSLGRALPARAAARRAVALTPRSISAHCALGGAEAALGRGEAAEKALLAALEIDANSPDVWVQLGAARRLSGNFVGAEAALHKALRLEPEHAAANAALAPERRDRSRALKIWSPVDNRAALGMAVDYLSKKAVFARLMFGEWSRTLANQAGRGHQLFVVDGDEQVFGYLGWALTHEPLAEQWLQGRSSLTDDQCRGGDCVLVNAWAADTVEAERLVLAAAREIIQDKKMIYFKRFYSDGRARPVRLSANKFMAGHVANSAGKL